MIWYSNLAYAVGLLVTDGNLSGDGRHITMRSSDMDLLEAFNVSLKMSVTPRQSYNNGYAKKPSYRIQFSNVKLYRWLLKIGLFPAKTYTIGKINIPDRYFRDFIRGHLDGDGNIMFYKDKYNSYKNHIYINNRIFVRFISASQIHINWLKSKFTRLLDIKGAVYQTTRENAATIWTIKFSKKESIKLLNFIYYKDNLPSLKRKRELAEWILKTIPNEKRKIYTKI